VSCKLYSLTWALSNRVLCVGSGNSSARIPYRGAILQTLALFSSGIFLAKMQASHFDLESVEFLSFQASGDSPAPTGSGPGGHFLAL
jgi:hypothetical protein